MIFLVILMLVIALVAAILGFGKLMAAATYVAIGLFGLLLASFVIGLLYRRFIRRPK